MFSEKDGVFPIDLVHYVIEVKSRLDAASIRDAISKSKAILELSGPCPHRSLFGYESDTTSSESEFSRIEGFQKDSMTPAVNVYCSVGKGYTYHQDGVWKRFPAVDKRAEVIGFLIGILNTLMNPTIRFRDCPPGKYLAWWDD